MVNITLHDYISVCSGLFGWEQEKKDLVLEQATRAIKYYNAPKQRRFEELHALEDRWYQSLANGTPDFAVYDDDLILADVWACWVVYSRGYLKTIQAEKSLFTRSIVSDIGDVSSVVDLGCGVGYTTAALKHIFPNADVYGTNIEGTKQYKVAQENGRIYNFKVRPSVHQIEAKGSLLFASEYFEHFQKPIDHLIEVLNIIEPCCLILANSFASKSVGHFDVYDDRGVIYGNRQISRIFNKELAQLGYTKIKTKCWNDRPSYFKLRSKVN